MMNNKLYLLSTKLNSKWDRLNTEININSGVKVNFLVHLQSFAGKIFSTCKLVRPLAIIFLWNVIDRIRYKD